MNKKTPKPPEQKPVVVAPKYPCQIDRCGKESKVFKVTSQYDTNPLMMCDDHYKSWLNNHRPYFMMACPCCAILIIM